MKITTEITLRITWNETECGTPDSWRWADILDMPDPQDVQVIASRDVATEKTDND